MFNILNHHKITITKELTQYVLTDKWILAPNLGYPRYKIQFAKCRKLQKNEDQSVDTVQLLRIGNKTPMKGVTETKIGDEMKGWTIQRLPYPGINPIISFQTLTLLHTLTRFCRKDTDIAIPCEAMPGPSKHRRGYSQSAIGWITGPPVEELEKVPKELKGSATLQVEQQYEPISTLRVLVSSSICSRRWPSQPSLGREAHWSCKLYMHQYRGKARAKKWEGGRRVEGRAWGTFGIALEM